LDLMVRDIASRRILVVEDEAAQRTVLSEILAVSGYEYECASSCAEARSIFLPDRYSCALIDLGLPDGSGVALLEEFAHQDAELVPVILTADSSPETIIDTLRAGAFDYLCKPVNMTTLQAAVGRALAHHAVRLERSELLRLVLEEREQLRHRVDEATAHLRQHAAAIEAANARLKALLELTHLSKDYYCAEETLLRQVFEGLAKLVPLDLLALGDTQQQSLAAVQARDDGAPRYMTSDRIFDVGRFDTLLAEAEPELLFRSWLEHDASVDIDALTPYVSPQTFPDRTTYVIAFYLTGEEADDLSLREFLDMAAFFLAFELERGKLLLQVAHQASLGNIAMELARNFIQPLTAIRTAVDFVSEASEHPEIAEGTAIIQNNVERLRRQTQEFRRLSTLREGAIETVRLDECLEQALDMLSVAIQNRNLTVEKDYCKDCECVLLNGTALARSLLDLILAAIRSVEIGGCMYLTLSNVGREHVALDIAHATATASAGGAAAPEAASRGWGSPSLQLAERTIHSCGGTLTVKRDRETGDRARVLLPRNVTRPSDGRTIS
jgi:DNA-binding response OmpR family regulator